ncbi:hypothetical protein IFM89_014619 [Coptis chinensis]|uniref:Uncharacterized protein n=1 Tax=Coptis chinensis TaxID=261450 RepID=A0A835MBD2_9MAGN|nr:hypothetical protein IFM89_014619 [Coptis chinensis]
MESIHSILDKDVLDDKSFEKYKNGLIANKLEKDPSLSYETDHLWGQIVDKSNLPSVNFFGPILSFRMCTEVFQFDVSSSANPGVIVLATPAVNVSTKNASGFVYLSKRNRRISS